MSSVFKLSIKGIRSFDPIETETIEFSKPLTLIVGSNGSGKTTIIECLKFATTGDLPPNSKGGAFIHDPNIGGEKSVIAQVKLAFNNINNKNMILTKTLQLINKKTSNTFKTLENQLVVLNNGERVTISTKAADIEQLVPQFLGVTKSILNYVIFCHQEDSLWPISEPAVLKKRFDEIFDSVKFIKVLDNFKDLRKQFNEDIKLLTNNVDHLKQERRRANNKRIEKEDLQATIKKYDEEIADISRQLEQVTARMDELFKSNQDYEIVINKIESLQHQNISLKGQIQKLRDNIEFLSDSDNELQNKLTNFNEIQSSQKESLNTLKSKANELNDSLSRKRLDLNKNIGLEGELKSLKKAYENCLNERKLLMEQNDLGLIISENITDDLLQEYKNSLQDQTSSNKKHLGHLITQNTERRTDLESKISKIRDSRMKEEQHLKYYSEDIANYKSANSKIETSIKAIRVDEGELLIEKEDLVNLETNFSNIKKENKVASISSEISSINKEIKSLESEVEELNHQIATSSKQNEVVTRVELAKEQIVKNSKRISILINENSSVFKEKTGEELRENTCTEIIEGAIGTMMTKIEEENIKYDMAQRENYDLKTAMEKHEQELKDMQKEVETKLQRIHSVLPDDVDLKDYEDYVKDIQSDYDTLSENISITEVTVRFNEAAISSAQKDHYCLLCRRGFEEKELSKFLKMLQEHNEKIKSGKDTKERDLMKRELSDLKDVQQDIIRVRFLQAREIGNATSKLDSIKSDLEISEKTLKRQKDLLESLKHENSSLESMRSTTREIKRLFEERQSFEKQLQSLQDELFGVELKSISSLQEEQGEINLVLKKKRRDLNTLIETKDESLKQVSRLELKIKEKTLEIANREKELIDLRNLRKQQDENNKKIELLTETVSVSERAVKDLELELQENTENLLTMQKENALKENEAHDNFNRYDSLLAKFNNYCDAIQHYLTEDLPKAEACKRESKVLEKDIQQLQESLKLKGDEISQLERELADADKTLRNIRDNIDLRSLESELNSNLSIIDDLEKQNARISRDNYQKETNDLNQHFSNLKSEHAMKTGEILQLSKQIKSIEFELQKDYKNIEKKYNEEFLRLQTKFFVNNDLSVYSKALDNAIMKFHSLKMKEINEIIDQLWRTTYSGSDVDTILIKSESNTVGVKSGNRSYNYRVVMVKQGVELDMRGRCSAGQKVLASIIIRLALAECFGINFGMITLDEPTTNLDEDNIESLARSLNQIIEMRQKQKNFQLIVITHDEKFLKFMGAAKFADLYYRISRDERQTSVIEAVPIAVIND